MDETRPPTEQPEETTADPPAAVQWMMQQAAAGLSAASLPGALDERLAAAPQPTEATLAARQQRVADALRANDRLTAGLPDDAATALLDLGLAMAGQVVADTAELDDAAAEDVLQPRARAVRRLMMAATEAATLPTPPADAVAEWTRQAAVALGDHFAPPDPAAERALADAWRAAGQPTGRIAALRRFIEEHSHR
ncbi:protein of unknown function [Candidatus Promineifilum breve]|uniref:Uncharacterized protein n=1 Tax=Candidatus Promineifilum breve TaxID=1806508 RepID=A0A160T4W0_9CHLR|nr:hypothetical protein [Candidatus Promineifilum breve]CUS03690.2 protein of unknown function [Candidatus Promineifilum breve]